MRSASSILFFSFVRTFAHTCLYIYFRSFDPFSILALQNEPRRLNQACVDHTYTYTHIPTTTKLLPGPEPRLRLLLDRHRLLRQGHQAGQVPGALRHGPEARPRPLQKGQGGVVLAQLPLVQHQHLFVYTCVKGRNGPPSRSVDRFVVVVVLIVTPCSLSLPKRTRS